MISNKKTLSATIACLLAVNTLQANAALVTLNISGNTNTTAGVVNSSDANVDTVSMYAHSNVNEYPDYSSASASGNNSGWFYSTSSGNNNFETESKVTQTYNVTNDSNSDQFFDFSFQVMNGSIDANCGDSGYGYGYGASVSAYGSGCAADDFAEAGYTAEILLDGSSIWSSRAKVTTDLNGSVFDMAGATFNNSWTSSNSLHWSATLFNVNLGLVAASASFVLEYVVTTRVVGETEDASYAYNNAYAQFGDPNDFNSYGSNTFDSSHVGVPEPAGLALFGLGLAGLAVSRRKNKTSL